MMLLEAEMLAEAVKLIAMVLMLALCYAVDKSSNLDCLSA